VKSFLHRIIKRFRPDSQTPVVLNPVPPRVVILMTNPRSGSTWLFDALRCHPSVTVRPTADVFTFLGMSGRRYPRDLAGDPADSVRVEVRAGEWDNLPNFRLPAGLDSQAERLPVWEVEKGHPQFFGFDVPLFAGKLKALSVLGCDVRMVYQVRDPRESMTSFLRYKERNPDWFAHITPERVPTYNQRIFEGMLACAQAYPGLIVDYQELRGDVRAVLARLSGHLWSDPTATSPDLLEAITHATGRSQREKTPFLGNQTTQDSDVDSYAALFEQNTVQIDASYAAYHGLLALRGEEASV